MSAPARVRVLTPEHLDAAAAALVNTAGSALGTAVSQKAGTSVGTATGVTTATPNSLMGRDANARTQIADPAVAADAATKGYVDTTVSGYVATSTRGAASGVATLDGSSFVTASQLPTYLSRQMGSGPSLPSSGQRQGDTYYHNTAGCLYEWDGAHWNQASPCSVPDVATRDSVFPANSPLIHQGFRVWVISQNQEHVYDQRNVTWRGTRALPMQSANHGVLTVTTAQAPYVLASVSVADPGYPYFLAAQARGEGGSTAAGTRWDTQIGSLQGSSYFLLSVQVHGENGVFTTQTTGPAIGGGPSATAYTGACTVQYRTVVVYGSANASFTQYNNILTVQVVPA